MHARPSSSPATSEEQALTLELPWRTAAVKAAAKAEAETAAEEEEAEGDAEEESEGQPEKEAEEEAEDMEVEDEPEPEPPKIKGGRGKKKDAPAAAKKGKAAATAKGECKLLTSKPLLFFQGAVILILKSCIPAQLGAEEIVRGFVSISLHSFCTGDGLWRQ